MENGKWLDMLTFHSPFPILHFSRRDRQIASDVLDQGSLPARSEGVVISGGTGMPRSCSAVGAIAESLASGGGGRPNMAQAGGKNPAGIDAALAKAAEVVAEQVK